MMLMPIARTPMDKKSGKGMERYFKDVSRTIDRMNPWSKRESYERKKRQLKSMGVKSGEIVVIGESLRDDRDNPVYNNAKVV